MLRVFENNVLKIFGTKKDEITGESRKLHNAELHALYCTPNIIRNLKSRRLRPPVWYKGNVVASRPAGPGSTLGWDNFLVEGISRIFLNRKTRVRKFRPHLSPGIIWPS